MRGDDDWPSDRAVRIAFGVAIALQLAVVASCAREALAARPTPIAAGRDFSCTPTAVWDGDGPIWCAERHRVRLAGIAARELDGRCRRYQPCPASSGIAARDRLVQLLGGPVGRTADGHVKVAGPALACRSLGSDRFGRVVAWCSSRGADLSCALLRTGTVKRWPRYHGRAVCTDRNRIGSV